jgi:hypothetical protein
MLSRFKSNSAKLWSHLNSIIKPKTSCDIPLSPDTLNDYFTSVFQQAPSHNSNDKLTIPNNAYIKDSMVLFPITLKELHQTCLSISNSSSVGCDGLNPMILKDNFALLSHQLFYIFNMSFEQGVFPQMLKSAIVTPIFKSGSHSDPGNYRPISILSLFSKLLEKLFYNRLVSFVNKHNLLHNFQFGFRASRSTAVAHAHVLSSLIDKCNHNKKIVVSLLDLKKAFDLINHELLLRKLYFMGIRASSLTWLTSYLNNRNQRTKLNAKLSDTKPISAGVPQGSILGPLLFILFINDVFQLSREDTEIYLYADDTTVIFSAETAFDLQNIINDFFHTYTAWCTSNCNLINPSKSNYLMFNVSDIAVNMNGVNLVCVKSAKFLGIYIDDTLSWKSQVEYVTKQCCQRIGMFKKVLPYLSNDVALLYYNAFIRSRFSYCLMFWIHNNRSGRYKLFDKIDNVIYLLANRCGLTVDDYVTETGICNVLKTCKLQCIIIYVQCNA